MDLTLAHATHFLSALPFLTPLVAVVAWVAVQNLLDRRVRTEHRALEIRRSPSDPVHERAAEVVRGRRLS